jgi:hypothetical protein
VLNETLYKLANTVTIDANVTFPTSNVTTITAGSFENAADRITAYNGNVDLSLYIDGISYPGVVVDGNTYVGTTFDSVVESYYGNVLGVDPNDIIVDGGAYYDTYNSHAPEELIPGQLFDSLNISVYTGIAGNSKTVGYRITHNMTANATASAGNVNYKTWPQYYSIFAANASTLTSNLYQTDTTIHVANANNFANPNPALALPGVVYVNGEKIVFYKNYSQELVTPWTADLVLPAGSLVSYGNLVNIQLTTGNIRSNVYLTTGNVFAPYFANIVSNVTLIDINSLGQIRRGVDGTGTPNVQVAGTQIVESDIVQLIPGGNVVHLTSWIETSLPTSANIVDEFGDYIGSNDGTGNISILNTGATVGLSAPALESSITPQAMFIKGQG